MPENCHQQLDVKSHESHMMTVSLIMCWVVRLKSKLIDRDGLGKVSRDIRVDALEQSQLVSDELHRKYGQKGGQHSVVGDHNGVLAQAFAQVSIIGNDVQLCTTRFNLRIF